MQLGPNGGAHFKTAKELRKELRKLAKGAGLPLGGRYGDLVKAWKKLTKPNGVTLIDLGLEIHHVPSDSAVPGLHSKDFPALVMLREDHLETDSRGDSSFVGAESSVGNFDAKFSRGFGEIVEKFPGDYDEGLKAMSEYYFSQTWPSGI
jgi:hypothetical protein